MAVPLPIPKSEKGKTMITDYTATQNWDKRHDLLVATFDSTEFPQVQISANEATEHWCIEAN